MSHEGAPRVQIQCDVQIEISTGKKAHTSKATTSILFYYAHSNTYRIDNFKSYTYPKYKWKLSYLTQIYLELNRDVGYTNLSFSNSPSHPVLEVKDSININPSLKTRVSS